MGMLLELLHGSTKSVLGWPSSDKLKNMLGLLKIGKLKLIKTKHFCSAKDPVQMEEQRYRLGENICKLRTIWYRMYI